MTKAIITCLHAIFKTYLQVGICFYPR